MRYIVLLTLFILSCSKKYIEPEKPSSIDEALQNEIARIEPMLLWCAGFPATVIKPECDGDGATYKGFYDVMSKTTLNDHFWSLITDEYGKPYRNANRVKNDNSDSFSRDQLLGVMEASLVSERAKQTLVKIWDYYLNTGKLCDNATDNRCDVNQSMKVLKKDIFKESVSNAERTLDEQTIRAEGLLSPEGYQTFLPVRKIMVHALTGTLTTGYIKVFNEIYSKYHLNMYNRAVYLYVNKKSKQEFDDLKKDLVECMKKFTVVNADAKWAWDVNVSCPLDTRSVWGHDLVALAKFVN